MKTQPGVSPKSVLPWCMVSTTEYSDWKVTQDLLRSVLFGRLLLQPTLERDGMDDV